MNQQKFYVYALFDHLGIPRYIGKGKGSRWNQHEAETKGNNFKKAEFIKETLAAIGEIPKVKLQENLSEQEAFDIERAFIKAHR